ncbi:MAG: CPBP family intramembrane glutamic endopeptidase [Flammeovirgaceae bacterium]
MHDFEDTVVDGPKTSSQRILYHFLFFGFAYYGVLIPKLLFTKQLAKLKNPHLWIKSLCFIGLIGICGGILVHYQILDSFQSYYEKRFIGSILNNSRRLALYVIPLLIIKFIYDRQEQGLYGLQIKGVDFRPYFYMLLIMLPLITIASFNEAFLKQYPRFFWRTKEVFGLAKWQMATIFELFYGMDFLFVELMFRGALIVGMTKLLGKDSVLPMAVMYGFLHFGKPVGEAVSSVFGGYLLGIFAYYSRNIWGGVFIHMGIALLMELTAGIQHWLRGDFG